MELFAKVVVYSFPPLIIYAKNLDLKCWQGFECASAPNKEIFKKMSFIRVGQSDGDSFSLCVFLNMFISFVAILYNNKYVTIMAIWSSKNIFSVDVSLKNAEQSIRLFFFLAINITIK